MGSIYFVGNYKPMTCGIGDYTSFITRESPLGKWGVLSFNLENSWVPLTGDAVFMPERVWYGIPSRYDYSTSVILDGLKQLGTCNEDAVIWFQHENGIWPDNVQLTELLRNLNIPKVITFHTLHFQSPETPTGLRKNQYRMLEEMLPHVEAVTVFSYGVYHATISAFPEYREKIHIVKHGVHSYPEIGRLSRKEAKEKFNDFLLYESSLEKTTREDLHKQRVFLDPKTVVIGQTGFLSSAKQSEILYTVRNELQRLIPHKRIIALRVGCSRDRSQEIYAENLIRKWSGSDEFLLNVWLPQSVLPLAQRAFDINFYWPSNCTQSGVLAHALGAGAVVAGRDLEGVGETLKEAGGLADTDLWRLLLKMRNLILNPGLGEKLEDTVRHYAMRFSWQKQALLHYELAEHVLSLASARQAPQISFGTIPAPASGRDELSAPARS
jgi:hypothetical protein